MWYVVVRCRVRVSDDCDILRLGGNVIEKLSLRIYQLYLIFIRRNIEGALTTRFSCGCVLF